MNSKGKQMNFAARASLMSLALLTSSLPSHVWAQAAAVAAPVLGATFTATPSATGAGATTLAPSVNSALSATANTSAPAGGAAASGATQGASMGSQAASTDATGGFKSGKAGQAADSGTQATATDARAVEGQVQAKAQRTSIGEVEFQRFVRDTTGRSLPLFGYELFADGPFTASQGAAVPASYILGTGDEVVVQAYGLVDFTERLVIDREGRVLIPKVGPLTLSGVPLGQAERVISAHLSKVYRNFNLTVTMGRVRSTEAFVVGQARNPGKHVVSGLSSLINALFETGGPPVKPRTD